MATILACTVLEYIRRLAPPSAPFVTEAQKNFILPCTKSSTVSFLALFWLV
eukprot:CAMPEP_0206226116 /NCGR_PEP_ID=MMETSP0047_2-20121206/7900_1 /ASSEMBLY_ACC=CAM_ASM_000192 /TAXON_ID=195065 /ORGANISM="Chroomonas mesostigmatica_cf, Strain CCMP1168" /LENGTH=50 /DNA_ID=CAMNT_0053649143 /DNA_START=37 /DNA_END=189 /DNA_ORIENTATION=+